MFQASGKCGTANCSRQQLGTCLKTLRLKHKEVFKSSLWISDNTWKLTIRQTRAFSKGEKTESKLLNCLSQHLFKTTPDILEIKQKHVEWGYKESLLRFLQFKWEKNYQVFFWDKDDFESKL